MADKPVWKKNVYGIEVAVWENADNKLSVTINKTYKPKGGNDYFETNTFFPDELPRLIAATQAAYNWIYLERSGR